MKPPKTPYSKSENRQDLGQHGAHARPNFSGSKVATTGYAKVSGKIADLHEDRDFAVVVSENSDLKILCHFDTIRSAGFNGCRIGAQIDLEVSWLMPDATVGIAICVLSMDGKPRTEPRHPYAAAGSIIVNDEVVERGVVFELNMLKGTAVPGRAENVQGQKPTKADFLKWAANHGASRETLHRVLLEIAGPRPKWRSGLKDKPPELRGLSSIQFMLTVYDDLIEKKEKDGVVVETIVYKDSIRRADPGLMTTVEVYLNDRMQNNKDLGEAAGITFVAARPARNKNSVKKTSARGHRHG